MLDFHSRLFILVERKKVRLVTGFHLLDSFHNLLEPFHKASLCALIWQQVMAGGGQRAGHRGGHMRGGNRGGLRGGRAHVGQIENVDAQIEQLENADAHSGCTALICAAENGHSDCVLLLLEAGADKEFRDDVRH